MNQELLEMHLCNQGSHYEKYTDGFCYTKEAIMCNHQIKTFHCRKDKWDTKEDTSKPIRNAVHVLWYAKRHLSSWNDIEQWKFKPVALAVIKLC